ncbi:MAG: hypothetical protein WCF81_23070 [Roseiarcus sp.]
MASGLLAWKSPDFDPWIGLDFLGFSHAKRDLSIGYEEKAERKFFSLLFPSAIAAPGAGDHDSGLWKAGALMQQAYLEF